MAHETKRPLKVFLCHASGDKPPVRELYKRLVAEGVDAWLDQEKLLPGQDWRVEIPRAVSEADVVVICLSNKSITREGYVQKEIKFALDSAEEKPEGTIFLIPARLEDCVVPERLNRWQWVDLFEENGFVKLLRSLKLRADAVGVTIEPIAYEDSDKEREHRLEQLYTEGLAAFYTEDWDRACRRFQSILKEQPNHKAALEKLAEAERQRSLAKLYAEATEAYGAENWQVAIKTLEELSQKSAAYKDVAQLLGNARKQKQLRDLYAEAKTLHMAKKWQAVLKVFEQISVIEPQYPDPDGLLTSAQKEVAELNRLGSLNDLYSQGLHKMDAGEWYEARGLLEQVHKAQTGFLDTEPLLRKVENEILRVEEGHKRNAQVQMLYEQARKMTQASQWGKALAQMEEIQKLDNQFVDKNGILEKAKAELEREEQEAQRRRELAALYAEAVSLLEAKKYQEALEKWNAVQAIDPKYKDASRVKITARRKLDELSRPEAVARPWSKIMSDWLRLEANVPSEREILSEKLLLLSFAVVVILRLLWFVLPSLLDWQSNPILAFVCWAPLGGLYGAVVAFALSKVILNWRLKHSLILIVGWAVGLGVSFGLLVANLAEGNAFAIYRLFTILSVVAAIKWSMPHTRAINLILILVSWILAWIGGSTLTAYLNGIFFTQYAWAFIDGLLIMLGLLFTFGILVEEYWAVLKTAIFGALGFAVGNFIAYLFSSSSLMTKIADPIGLSLWGIIGGAILEAPSRNARRILFSAGLCGMSLLLGYAIALVIYPAVAGLSSSAILRYQVSYGIGLGLGLGLLIRRASAIGVLVVLGVGIYMITRALNVEVLDILGIWENIVRGALIGLVLGYGYGYMRKAQPLQNKSGPVIAKRSLIGIIGIVTIAIVMIAITLSGNNGASRTVAEFTVRVLDETCPIYPAETDIEGFVSESNDLLAPWSGTSVQFQGTDECTNREMLGVSSLIYRYQLKFNEVTQLTSIAVSGAAFNGPDSVLRVLDENKNILGTMSTFGGNSFQTHVITLQGVEGRIFFVDEFDTSTTWRLRQKIVVNGHFP